MSLRPHVRHALFCVVYVCTTAAVATHAHCAPPARAAEARLRAQQSSAARECTARARRSDPELDGKVTVRCLVSAKGRPAKVSVSTDSPRTRAVGRCIADRARRWHFPAPREGEEWASFSFVLVR